MRILILICLLLISSAAYAEDLCGCTRESKDPVCVAYYELLDEGFDVRVTCEKKEGE